MISLVSAFRKGRKLLLRTWGGRNVSVQSLPLTFAQSLPRKFLHEPVKANNTTLFVDYQHDAWAVSMMPSANSCSFRSDSAASLRSEMSRMMPVNASAPRLLDFANGQVHRKRGAVFPQADNLPPDADNLFDARMEVIREVAVMLGRVRIRHQRRNVFAYNSAFGVAENLLGRRVDRFNNPVVVDTNDRINGRLQNRTIDGLTTFQPMLAFVRAVSIRTASNPIRAYPRTTRPPAIQPVRSRQLDQRLVLADMAADPHTA